jgi:hypothetical protein
VAQPAIAFCIGGGVGVDGGDAMDYECRQCGTGFTKRWGGAKCPGCGGRDLWITTGATIVILEMVLRMVAVLAPLLAITFLVSYVAFFGAVIAAAFFLVFGLPWAVWTMLRARKPAT